MYYTILGLECDKKAMEYLGGVLGFGLIIICGLALAANSEWYF